MGRKRGARLPEHWKIVAHVPVKLGHKCVIKELAAVW